MSFCNDCGDNSSHYTPFYNNNCNTPINCTPTDSTCVIYTGPVLNCLGVTGQTNLENILISLDEQVCNISGTVLLPIVIECLNGGEPIDGLQNFINILGADYCAFKSDYNAFKEQTNLVIIDINNTIDSILNPEIASCSFVGISMSDSIITIQNKQNTAICSLWSYVNLAGINWGSGAPLISNVNNAFQYVLSLINNTNVLPSFDNTDTCLVDPTTATDSLISTISNINATICDIYSQIEIPVISTICLTPPTTIASLATFVYSNISTLWGQRMTYDSNYFTVSNGATTCDPKLLTLNDSFIGKVKVNVGDTLDYLEDQFTAGSGINITTNNVTGKIVISNTFLTGLTSVGANFNNGTALSITNSPLTSNGSLVFNWDGLSTEYIKGDGTLGTLPSYVDTNIGNTNQTITDTIRVVNINSNLLRFSANTETEIEINGAPYTSYTPGIRMISKNGMSLSNFAWLPTYDGLALAFSTVSTTPAILKTDYLTGAPTAKTHQLPNDNGTYVLKVNGVYADATGAVTIPVPNEIQDNGYFYGSTVTSYKGFDTLGGIATGPTRYITTSSNVTIFDSDHFLVLDLSSGAAISLPNPQSFPGRILHFKIDAKGDVPLSPYAVYNYTNIFNKIITSSLDATVLIIKSSEYLSSWRWEIMQLNSINQSLLSI